MAISRAGLQRASRRVVRSAGTNPRRQGRGRRLPGHRWEANSLHNLKGTPFPSEALLSGTPAPHTCPIAAVVTSSRISCPQPWQSSGPSQRCPWLQKCPKQGAGGRSHKRAVSGGSLRAENEKKKQETLNLAVPIQPDPTRSRPITNLKKNNIKK